MAKSMQVNLAAVTPTVHKNQPIVDKSLATAITAATEFADEVYGDYVDHTTQQAVDEETRNFLDRKGALHDLDTAFEQQRLEEKRLEDFGGTGDDLMTDKEFLEARSELETTYERMGAAKSTGELAVRIAVKTKDLINRHPGKADEIRALSKKLIGDIDPILDFYQAQEKAVAEAKQVGQTNFLAVAQQSGAPLINPGESFAAYHARVRDHVQRYQDQVAFMKDDEFLDVAARQQLLKQFPNGMAAVSADFANSIHALAAQPGSAEAKLAAMQAAYNQYTTALYDRAGARNANDPAVQNTIKQLDATLALYQKVATGEIQASEADNTRKYIENASLVFAYNQYPALVKANILRHTYGPALGQVLAAAPNFNQYASSVTAGMTNLQFDNVIRQHAGSGLIPSVFKSVTEQSLLTTSKDVAGLTPDEAREVAAARSTIINSVLNPNGPARQEFGSDAEYAQAVGAALNALASPATRELYVKGGVELGELATQLNGWRSTIAGEIKNSVGKGPFSLALDRGVVRVESNGTLTPAQQGELNYLRRSVVLWNHISAASENMLGVTPDSTFTLLESPPVAPPAASGTASAVPDGEIPTMPQPIVQTPPSPVFDSEPISLATAFFSSRGEAVERARQKELDAVKVVLAPVYAQEGGRIPGETPEDKIRWLKGQGIPITQVAALFSEFNDESTKRRMLNLIRDVYGN